MRYELRLDRLRVPVSIGIHEHERISKQTLEVWVRVSVDARAKTDNIASVFDYDAVRNFILDFATTGHFELQETFASGIARFCAGFDVVVAGSVRTSKPDIFADADGVGCVVYWDQSTDTDTLDWPTNSEHSQ